MSRAQQAVRGTFWTTGATYVTMVAAFVGNLILARLLFPEDFGTFALASSTLTVVFLLSGFGSQEAIVQCRDKSINDLIPTAFWMTIGLGFVLGIAGTILGLVIFYTRDNLLGELIIILTWLKLVDMIGFAYQATLIRDLQYRILAYQSLFPTLISFIVAVIMALLGYGIWALVARAVVDTFMRLLICRRASSFRLQAKFDRLAARWIWDFGWRAMFSRIGQVIFGQWDNLVVGIMMGTAMLGNYAVAYRLAITGGQVTQQPIAAIAHSTYASAQSEQTNLEHALQTAVFWLSRTAVLLALLVWFAGAEVTVLLYGEKWALAATTFRHMFLFVALLPLLAHFRVFLMGSGHINRQLIAQGVQIISFFPLLLIAASRGSLVGVSWSLNFSSIITLIVVIYFVQQIVSMKWRYVFLDPLGAGLLTAILTYLATRFLSNVNLPDWSYVLFIVLVVGAAYLLLTLLFEGRAVRNEVQLIRKYMA